LRDHQIAGGQRLYRAPGCHAQPRVLRDEALKRLHFGGGIGFLRVQCGKNGRMGYLFQRHLQHLDRAHALKGSVIEQHSLQGHEHKTLAPGRLGGVLEKPPPPVRGESAGGHRIDFIGAKRRLGHRPFPTLGAALDMPEGADIGVAANKAMARRRIFHQAQAIARRCGGQQPFAQRIGAKLDQPALPPHRRHDPVEEIVPALAGLVDNAIRQVDGQGPAERHAQK